MYSFHLTISASAKKRGSTHSRVRARPVVLHNKQVMTSLPKATGPVEITAKPVLVLLDSEMPPPPPPSPVTPRPSVCVDGLPEGGWSGRVARVEYPDLPWVPSCIDSPGFRPRDDKRAWRRRVEWEAASRWEEEEYRASRWEEEEEEQEYGSYHGGYYYTRPRTPPFDATIRRAMALEMGEMVKCVAAANGEERNTAILVLLDHMLGHKHMRAFFDSAPQFLTVVRAKMHEYLSHPLATEEIRDRAAHMLEWLSW
jgi:hypothetical protein